MQTFILHQPVRSPADFRVAEVQAVADTFGIEIDVDGFASDSPYWLVKFRNVTDAVRVCSESVTVEALLELWGVGDTLEEVHSVVKRDTAQRWAEFDKPSFKFQIESYRKKLAPSEQRDIVESFSFLAFSGPIRMKNPDNRFDVLLSHDSGSVLRKVFFGRYLCSGNSRLIDEYDVKKRRFTGNTTFESELSLVTARLALAAPGKLVYDPFVGTGSFLYTCAQFGAAVMGSDIDGRQFRGSPAKGSLLSNIAQYHLADRYVDLFTCDIKHCTLRADLLLDAIVTDPPYGVRAGAKTIGRNNVARKQTEPVFLQDVGEFAHRLPDYYPPTTSYTLPDVVNDLMNFAAHRLKLGGRLVYWMPFIADDFQLESLPRHPSLRNVAQAVQHFGKWARILLAYEKVANNAENHAIAEDGLALAQFREKLFSAQASFTPKPTTSLLDVVKACDCVPRADSKEFKSMVKHMYRFYHASDTLGYVGLNVARALGDWPDVFALNPKLQQFTFAPALQTEASRSEAIRRVLHAWREAKKFRVLRGWRNEEYPVYGAGGVVLCSIERAAASLFGLQTYGSHLTAYVGARPGRNVQLWISRRAKSKQTYGGMLDNTVAGGIGYGYSPFETMVKECGEEASLDEEYVRRHLCAAGTISYITLSGQGSGGETNLLQPEVQHVYDLELPTSVTPRPNDDEVEEFRLMEVDEALQRMRAGEFKPNTALVVLDFLIRHGILTAENEPDYLEICQRLRRNTGYPTGVMQANSGIAGETRMEHAKATLARTISPMELFSGSPSRMALIVLNQQICYPRETFLHLWNAAQVRVCADGGANQLYHFDPELVPDCVTGDLDSLRDDVRRHYESAGVPIEQDADQYSTDFSKSLLWASKRVGVEDASFVVCGALGGRFDHTAGTMAQIYSWHKEAPDSAVYAMDAGNMVVLCPAQAMTVIDTAGQGAGGVQLGCHFGLLPVWGASSVSTRGARWNVDHTTLSFTGLVSSCNQYADPRLEIVVHSAEPIACTMELVYEE